MAFKTSISSFWSFCLLLYIDFLLFLVWQNFDLGSTVYISSQAFYAGVDPCDDFE